MTDHTAPQPTGPLHGLRVLELAGLGPGPFCAMHLADLGADVVRVDRPGGGTMAVEPRFDLLNRGKRSIALDLKDPADLQTALRLVERADVLIEGYRPGVAERLGLGPDACLARQPRLVYGRMTGWGQDGPRAHTAGHDLTYLAVTGVLHAMGRAGGPPQIPLNLVGDFGGGALYLATGILAALWEVQASGRGQVVDAAIVDGASHLATLVAGLRAGGAWRDQRGVNLLDSGAPFYDVYATADGGHMAVGPLEPQFFAVFAQRLGLGEEAAAQYDPATWPRLRAAIAERFAQRTRQEWTEVFADGDGCVAPVLSWAEAPADPQLRARQTYVDRDGVVQPAPAPRFSRTPATLSGPPAEPGAHTAQVLADWSAG
ncbi:CaiB/BaiF CoA transferase family protein [Catellatospora tritici]|uniref:CaiB/BaiF CoA transferase family protein n=1 Tax=Catellatospora tritici TaxID=2851566 RepID=UPI001C2CFD78|nr:CaiB/BaiF CoA-transferase family protein [Catellatospora tritici]MBV1852660.1 CoA transferase [Catellatospora tritici]